MIPVIRILLASIRLNQEEYAESLEQIEIAIDQLDSTGATIATVSKEEKGHAFAIRGMLRLHNGELDGAADDFLRAKESDPTHSWAHYGAAVGDEARQQHEAASTGYERALELATTDEHRAACLFRDRSRRSLP